MLRGGLEDILSLSPSWEEANSFLKIYDYIRTNIKFHDCTAFETGKISFEKREAT